MRAILNQDPALDLVPDLTGRGAVSEQAGLLRSGDRLAR